MERSMFLVSVVIPVFNGAELVGRAIDSVLRQTVPVHEIIVVNDGSTDGTSAVLGGYGDRIRVISIPNGGVSRARNHGLRAVTGDLIALLDADDVWHADKIAAQLDVLGRHPDVEFVCCNFMTVSSGTSRPRSHFEGLAPIWSATLDRVVQRPSEALIVENCVGTCSNVMFTRRLLEAVGPFDVALKQAEDYDLWLRMSRVSDFYLQSAVLLDKVVHGGNLTHRFDETLTCHAAVLKKFQLQQGDLFAQRPALQAVLARSLGRVRYDLAGVFFAKGRRREGYSALYQALRADPGPVNILRCLRRALRRALT